MISWEPPSTSWLIDTAGIYCHSCNANRSWDSISTAWKVNTYLDIPNVPQSWIKIQMIMIDYRESNSPGPRSAITPYLISPFPFPPWRGLWHPHVHLPQSWNHRSRLTLGNFIPVPYTYHDQDSSAVPQYPICPSTPSQLSLHRFRFPPKPGHDTNVSLLSDPHYTSGISGFPIPFDLHSYDTFPLSYHSTLWILREIYCCIWILRDWSKRPRRPWRCIWGGRGGKDGVGSQIEVCNCW